MPLVLLQAIKGEDIVIKGDGLAIRSYMDLDDLGNWLCRLLFLNQILIYNFGLMKNIYFRFGKENKILSESSSNILVLGKNNVTLSNPLEIIMYLIFKELERILMFLRA